MIWGYGMWGMGLVWPILLGLLVWLVVWSVRPAADRRRTAVEILEERFARGELDAGAYRLTRSELERI